MLLLSEKPEELGTVLFLPLAFIIRLSVANTMCFSWISKPTGKCHSITLETILEMIVWTTQALQVYPEQSPADSEMTNSLSLGNELLPVHLVHPCLLKISKELFFISYVYHSLSRSLSFGFPAIAFAWPTNTGHCLINESFEDLSVSGLE